MLKFFKEKLSYKSLLEKEEKLSLLADWHQDRYGYHKASLDALYNKQQTLKKKMEIARIKFLEITINEVEK